MRSSIPHYYTDMTCHELTTKILRVETSETLTVLTLEDTIFHPQGGGQPTDRGTIKNEHGELTVTQVKRREDGQIEHIGTLLGQLSEGQTVQCKIDEPARHLHSRLHSAGHLIDVALEGLGLPWEPNKGYHFPEGPYVEYHAPTKPEEGLAGRLEEVLSKLIAQNNPTHIELQDQTRIITLAGKSIPCGGTHVQRLGEIGPIKIRYIKYNHGIAKIGYGLTP
ncbi:hypothetical protein KBD34_03760 [Patescibacteria group bacterium]|nr:hypothetical protein [Patescibacteria group bacterium]